MKSITYLVHQPNKPQKGDEKHENEKHTNRTNLRRHQQ